MPGDSRGSSRAAEKTRKEPGNGSGRGWPERRGDAERQKLTASSPDIHRALPHSVEAEQGVLGSMLISPRDIIAEAVEKINENYFYIPAHQTIYTVLVDLWNNSQGIDLITFTQVLRDRNLLDTVGGASFVTSLFTFVPTAANVGYYLEIVRDKYILREIISACTEGARRSYEEQDEVDNLLDEVEQRIYSVGEDRFKGQSLTMKDQVMDAIEAIEKLWEQKGSLTGMATGFIEFDRMTSGLHPSEMIVIAARPSMGKCLAFDSRILLSDGSVATIEEIYRKQQARLLTLKENWKLDLASPSHFIDDGLKPVFRVTTRLGKIVEATLPHPFLTINGWTKLARLRAGDRIAVPRKLNVFGRRKWRECEVKLLAYLIGDGCLTGSNPQFTSGNPIVQKEFATAVVEFGGLKAQLFDSNGSRTPSFRVASNRELIRKGRLDFGATLSKAIVASGQSSRQVALAAGVSPVSMHEWKRGNCVPTKQAFLSLCGVLESSPALLAPAGLETMSKNSRNSLTVWLDQLGIWKKDAHTKQIPAPIFTLVRPQLALFLNRLFATDGWATVLRSGQAQLGYATVSEELARQVQHLLLRFGVIASLRKRSVKYNSTRRTAWQLDVTDKLSIQTFISEIGIFGK